MTKSIRWRIIALQVVVFLVFAAGAGGALYASSFTSDQIHQQLAQQQIYFPKDAQSGLPADLSRYAGQQVLTGEQAHAYAEHFIALHLSEIGHGQPYSYWSGQALKETDPAAKAEDQAIAATLFQGTTLRSTLNVAWTFSVIGQVAFYAAIGLLVAGLAVLVALVFEVVEAIGGKENVVVLSAPPAHTQIEATR